jgi:hypothetical protein
MEHESSRSLHPDAAEKGKYIVQADPALEGEVTLPSAYGETRLVILPRDPLWFFAYWELTPERIAQLKRERGDDAWDRSALVLRVYDVTSDENDGIDHAPFFDVEVHRHATQWYVKVANSGRAYIAVLGVRLADGRFIALVRSNRIRLPVGRISDQIDSQWMAVAASGQDEWAKFLETSGGLDNLSRGSADIARTMANRWEFLKSIFSGSSSLSSGGVWRAPADWPGLTDEEKK